MKSAKARAVPRMNGKLSPPSRTSVDAFTAAARSTGRTVAKEDGVVDERMRQGLLLVPERALTRLGDDLGREAHHLLHEVLDYLTSPAGRDHLAVPLYQSVRRQGALADEGERGFPECQPHDG